MKTEEKIIVSKKTLGYDTRPRCFICGKDNPFHQVRIYKWGNVFVGRVDICDDCFNKLK